MKTETSPKKAILPSAVMLLFVFLFTRCALLPVRPDQTVPVEVSPLPTSRPPEQAIPGLAVRETGRFVHNPQSMTSITGFGAAVGASGDWLVVGATNWNAPPGQQQGQVFVYRRQADGWEEHAVLVASDAESGFQYDQHFGSAVAIDGEWLAVGAADADDEQAGDNTGAVYIFRLQDADWQEQAILHAPDAAAGRGLGKRLAWHGDTLLVTAGERMDSVYLFVRQGETWSAGQRLQPAGLSEATPSGEQAGSLTGYALALDDDWLAFSVVSSSPSEAGWAGSRVFLYQRLENAWRAAGVLESPSKSIDGFGFSLALDAGTLAIGAPGSGEAGAYSGSVYIFELRDGAWNPTAHLAVPDSGIQSGFGGSLALDGDLLAVAAPGDNQAGIWSGAVYLFQRQAGLWVPQQRLYDLTYGVGGPVFGSSLSLSGATLLVGAPDEFGYAAFVYALGDDARDK